MADRYEPKLSVRPTSERKGSEARPEAASDDPLFELARIVSGRGPAGGAPRPRAAEPPKPAAPAPDVVNDLEAELLSDLESSFAAVKQQISAQNGQGTQRSAEPLADEPAPPPRPTAPPQQAAPPAPPRPRAPVPPPASPTMAPAPPMQAAPDRQPAPPPQAAQPPAPPPVRQSRIPVRPPPQGGPVAQPPAPRAQPAPTAGGRKVDIANLQLRPSAVAPPRPNPPQPSAVPQAGPAEPPQPKPSRWDKPAEPPNAEASVASRFAPPKAGGAPAQPPQQPEPALEEEEFPFSEGFPFSGAADANANAAAPEDEFPLDGFDQLPGFDEDDQLAAYPDDAFDDMPRRGVPRSLIAIAGLLAVVLIGVGGFFLLRPDGGSTAAPPIITADSSPTKVAPPEPPAASEADQQNKLIYDRVDSGANGGTDDTTLVTPGSQPIAPATGGDTDNPISRVILPGGPVSGADDVDTTDGGNSDLAMNDGDSSETLGPRKVRTVVVRPDGTIVASDAVPADGEPASMDAGSTADVPAVPEIPPAATDDDTAAIAGGRSGEELAITPLNGTDTTPPEPPAAPLTAPTPPARTQTPTPPARTTTASNDQGPIDLTNSGGSAGANSGSPTIATATSGMMVQVSSQRSDEAARATFLDLQRRYSSILGGYDPDIQRADLGDRGVYYRVRVGPFSQGDAQELCATLKSAGGDCILARR